MRLTPRHVRSRSKDSMLGPRISAARPRFPMRFWSVTSQVSARHGLAEIEIARGGLAIVELSVHTHPTSSVEVLL